jgi:hypothetical protein
VVTASLVVQPRLIIVNPPAPPMFSGSIFDNVPNYRPGLTGLVSYTPIVIQFVPSILNQDGSPVVKQEIAQGFHYSLRISCPESNYRGTLATMPESFVINIPEDGLVRLQLAPTTSLLPKSYYVVEYFRSNSKKPMLTQHWAVPEVMNQGLTGTYSFEYQTSKVVLPLDCWQVTHLSLGDYWTAQYNSLVINEPPAPGHPVTVTYQRAVTLEDLVIPSQFGHRDRSRVRY